MRILFISLIIYTFNNFCEANDQNIALIVNKAVEIQQVTRLELYKIFTNSTDNQYKLICYFMKDSESETPLYGDMNDFIKLALDDKDMSLVKYKMMILDKIRKREVKVTLFKGQPEDVISEVVKNNRFIGMVPKSSIVNNLNVKEIFIK